MTPARLTILMLMVVAALVVAYVAKSFLFAGEETRVAELRNYPMLVSNLEPGAVITEAHLAQGPKRVDDPANPPVRTWARSNAILVGRVVKESLKAGQPIDTQMLYPPGEFPPVAVTLGMRAVSIEVGSGAAVVDGLVKQGEYVDVHFSPTANDDDRFRGGVILTMFKGVKVLSLNRTGTGGRFARGGNTVTLELTPEQANIMLLAQQKGSINLIYTPDGKGAGGIAVAEEDRVYFEEILGLKKPEEPKKPLLTELYYRTGRSVTAFNDDGTFWNGYGSNNGYNNMNGYGTGSRPAPATNGNREPSGYGNNNGYYRGIDLPGTQPGGANSGAGSALRLIPSPQAPQGQGPAGRGEVGGSNGDI